jgi:hypothetical protein
MRLRPPLVRANSPLRAYSFEPISKYVRCITRLRKTPKAVVATGRFFDSERDSPSHESQSSGQRALIRGRWSRFQCDLALTGRHRAGTRRVRALVSIRHASGAPDDRTEAVTCVHLTQAFCTDVHSQLARPALFVTSTGWPRSSA